MNTPPEGVTIEYAIRTPDGQALDPTPSLTEARARLDRYRDIWPEAVVAQREIRYSPWVPVPDANDAQPGRATDLARHGN